MKRSEIFIAILCYQLVGIGIGIAIGHKTHRIAPETQVITKTDTLLVYDTITREKPIMRFVETIRTDTVEVVTEKHDTINITLPIERKVYAEDSLYRAVVSGYNASLDSITVWPKTVLVTNEVTKIVSKSKWSFGVTAGPSVLATPDGTVHCGLGASVGVTYSF